MEKSSMSEISAGKRLEQLGKALQRLEMAFALPRDMDFRVEATIQCFEIAAELLWKCARDALQQRGLDVNSPLSVFQQAFAEGWIPDSALYGDMMRDRNLSSHIYNEDDVRAIADRAKLYLPAMHELYVTLKTRGQIS